MYVKGIIRSRNNGGTWEILADRIPYGEPPVGFSRIIGIDPLGTLYANAYLGLCRSFGDGDHWELVNQGDFPYPPYSLAVTPSGFAFVGTIGYGIYRTSNQTSPDPVSFVYFEDYPNPFNLLR